jgi:hypothetical protein
VQALQEKRAVEASGWVGRITARRALDMIQRNKKMASILLTGGEDRMSGCSIAIRMCAE